MRITLTSDELAYIKSIAEQRYAMCRANNFKNKSDPNIDSDLHGFAAEYAFSKFLGLPINVVLGTKNLHGADIGSNIDIKSAKYKTPGNLVIDLSHFKNDRIYCLAHTEGLPNYIDLIGWQTSEIIRNNCAIKINKSQGHKIIVYYKEELRPIAELLDYINI